MKLSDAVKRMLNIPELADGIIHEGLVTIMLKPTQDFELPGGHYQIRYGDYTIPLIITVPES